MKTPNLFFCAIILILVPSVSAQTSNNVRRTLGKPVTKVYRVDPNISVTINYDTEGQVCDIQLAGSYSSAQKFADKLIPIKSRGRQLGPAVGLIAMDCCQSFAYEYEKLTMITSMGTGQPVVRFVFKRRECVVRQPSIQGPPRFSPGAIAEGTTTNRGSNAGNANRIYSKYETTQPAAILDLPAPELTPEAIANPKLGEMIIEVVLEPSGKVGNNIVRMGSLKNGMADRAVAAAQKITFKPALLDGKPVAQRTYIKYSVQICAENRLCTRAVEVLEP